MEQQQAEANKYNLPSEINFSNKTIAVLGLTFKAGTDDIRNSAAIKIIQILLDREAIIQAFDPMGMLHTKKYLEALNYNNIFYATTALSACQNSDLILITTEWAEFKALPWETIKSQTKNPIIIDLRNILDADQLSSIGYKYHCIGQG
ncbi:UDP binding domain-containing protein [Candidatus Tisiphia endosymbiont of Beris chalybata]|uniref:UDP binding domain-containing protein n=1 Tax=Candidatus Tisiphia endosymbiont of Beris chalybata TaxID=3066262 RepID=UPI003977B965